MQLTFVRVEVEASFQQLVDADVLIGQHLNPDPELVDPPRLQRADDDRPLAADLRVEERVRHRERHLVARLRRADRVGDDQDVRHRRGS